MIWAFLRNLMAFERSIKNTLLYSIFSEFVKELEENIPFIFLNCIKVKNGALFLFKITNVLLLKTNQGRNYYIFSQQQ